MKRNRIGVAEFKIKKRASSSSSSMASAACGLFPLPCSCQNKWLSLRCKDFSGFFELILLGYVKCVDISSKYRCKLILVWKLETVAGSYSSPFFLRAFKQISTKSGQARTQVSFQFSHFSNQIIFNAAEKRVHISSRLLVCVWTFLLVDKIVFALLAFDDAAFSFCIKNFQMFRIILTSLGECSSSSSIFEISLKFQSVHTGKSRPKKNQSEREDLPKPGFAILYHLL